MATMKSCVLLALISGAMLCAQTKPEPSASPAAPQSQNPAGPKAQAPAPPKPGEQPQGVLKPEIFVRRFSAGATLTVSVLKPFVNRDQTVFVESPRFDALYTSTGTPHRVGWGFVGQIALTQRFALAANFLVRHTGYNANQDIFEGVDNPNTIADERKHTVRAENTSAKYYDIPVVVRFYTKDRDEPGIRGFFELGGSLRRVAKIATSTSTIVNEGTETVDTTTAPYRKSTRGLVFGTGVQIIDPVGVRVVPEVRYTYWLKPSFNNLATANYRHQIEAMISLTF